MDFTTAEHAMIGAVITLLLGCVGLPWIGFALVAGIFIGRELTQAEYRWISKYGGGLRANMPWWAMLDPRVWDFHSVTDLVAPSLASGLVILALAYTVGIGA